MRVGNGFDVHAFDPLLERPLVLCGVEIAEGPALAGHSDADVGTHAVIDALLGAGALGDLGTQFGVDDPRTAGVRSVDLLVRCVELVQEYRIANVDLTLIAQRPHLSSYRQAMRETLAAALKVDLDRVSVKFTSTDRLGALGRAEGIAAWATCLLAVSPR